MGGCWIDFIFRKKSEVFLGSVCVSGIILRRAGSVQGGGWIVKVKILKTQGNNIFFWGGEGVIRNSFKNCRRVESPDGVEVGVGLKYIN